MLKPTAPAREAMRDSSSLNPVLSPASLAAFRTGAPSGLLSASKSEKPIPGCFAPVLAFLLSVSKRM